MLILQLQTLVPTFINSICRIHALAFSIRIPTRAFLAVLYFTTISSSIIMTSALRPLQPRILKRRLVWHRNRDLRFHDHPFYDFETKEETTRITSVFVFDDAFGCGIQPSTCLPNDWKATHLGPHGMRVLLESVQDLRENSRRYQNILSQELVVRRGPTIPTLLDIVEKLVEMDTNTKHDNGDNGSTEIGAWDNIEYLYEICWNEEPGWYEQDLSENFKEALTKRFEVMASSHNNHKISLSIQTDMSCTLYHPDDLPAPGEWQPLSKKEKRRRQKQQERKSKIGKTTSDKPTTSPTASNSRNRCVDISLDRWDRMPRIMGDFRKIAREKAGVRQCRHHQQEDRRIFQESDESPLPSTSTHILDPGVMPSLEELLEPILTYIDDKDGEKQPILGLPNSVIRTVCQNSLRIHNDNLHYMKHGTDPNKRLSSIIGGETAGLKHLEDFVTNYAHTAQRSLASVENHQSSRLSHYLAFGCLSPRQVVAVAEASVATRRELQKTEETTAGKEENDGTWLISHMTMRDFFLYTCLASGKQFYRLEGIPVSQKVASSMQWKSMEGNSIESQEARKLWRSWATGGTGLPLVDAAMTELLQSGYCSNRVRQNAASVLTKDLNLDWRAGAEWFQFLLEDHCVSANWGNWLYFSGVGPDPKNRHFCTVSQAMKYDPNGTYVKQWIPSLQKLTSGTNKNNEEEYFLRPWDFDPSWQRPVVDPESQYTWRDLERLKETGRITDETTN